MLAQFHQAVLFGMHGFDDVGAAFRQCGGNHSASTRVAVKLEEHAHVIFQTGPYRVGRKKPHEFFTVSDCGYAFFAPEHVGDFKQIFTC